MSDFTGNLALIQSVVLKLQAGIEKKIQLSMQNDGKELKLCAPVVQSYDLKLPSSKGANGQFLQTDGKSQLSWATPATSSGNSGTILIDSKFTFAGANGETITAKNKSDGQDTIIPANMRVVRVYLGPAIPGQPWVTSTVGPVIGLNQNEGITVNVTLGAVVDVSSPVTTANNTLCIFILGVEYKITIPAATYTGASLATALALALNTQSVAGWNVTFSGVTNKLTVTNASGFILFYPGPPPRPLTIATTSVTFFNEDPFGVSTAPALTQVTGPQNQINTTASTLTAHVPDTSFLPGTVFQFIAWLIPN